MRSRSQYAGFAVYGAPAGGTVKITVQSSSPETDFATIVQSLSKDIDAPVRMNVRSTRAVLSVPAAKAEAARAVLRAKHPRVRIIGIGEAIEIYKEVGYPTDSRPASISRTHVTGTHAMATRAWRPNRR